MMECKTWETSSGLEAETIAKIVAVEDVEQMRWIHAWT
jgi:hypothetical protein